MRIKIFNLQCIIQKIRPYNFVIGKKGRHFIYLTNFYAAFNPDPYS